VPLLNTLVDGYRVVLAAPITQLSQLMGSNLIIGPGLSMGVLNDGLAYSKYRPCPLLVKYVEVGWLGQRTKLGFYDFRGEDTIPVPTR
jgi:3-hydroxyacyl-CoA dehydrogenase